MRIYLACTVRGDRGGVAAGRAICERLRHHGHEVITAHLLEDDVDTADRWVGKLFDAFETLGKSPGIGHKREDLTAYPILFWPIGNYLIIYRVVSASAPIEIVAITQSSRDIPSFLHRRSAR